MEITSVQRESHAIFLEFYGRLMRKYIRHIHFSQKDDNI